MTQRCGELSFTKEALAFLVVSQAAAEQLERNTTSTVGLFGFVDLAHAALADRTNDGIRTKMLAGREEIGKIRREAGGGRRHRARDALGRPHRGEVGVLGARVVVLRIVHGSAGASDSIPARAAVRRTAYSSRRAPGSSTSCFTRTRNCTASAPSTMRWS